MAESDASPEKHEEPTVVAGVLAEFAGPEPLKAAAARVRDEGFSRWDVHSPFPIHGMERAMGIRPTVLPWLVLAGGIAGGLAALVMQWYLNGTDFPIVIRGYPVVVSGKPLFSLPANIPIIFELIVLASAFAAFGGALLLVRLPQFLHPVLGGTRFGGATSDRFFISIDAADAKFDESATPDWLQSLGPAGVELLYRPAENPGLPAMLPWGVAALVVLALVPPLLIARARRIPSPRPRIHLVQDMDFQPKYRAQAASGFFADGRAMRPPVPGTIFQGGLTEDDHFWRGKVDDAWATTFPMPVDDDMMERGQQRFNIFCAACHGLVGDGDGMTAVRALERMEPEWATPVSLSAPAVREQPVGQIYNTITNGIRKMPSYAAQIPVRDRWAIVLYVRALQRSRAAGTEDVPEDKRDRLQ